jgi:alpha,alpha-trehalase
MWRLSTQALVVLMGGVLLGCQPTADDARVDTSDSGRLEFAAKDVRVGAAVTLKQLLEDEDTDGDRRITIDDPSLGRGRGDRRFALVSEAGHHYSVEGTYYLSNLLQEIALAAEAGDDIVGLDFEKVLARPADRISEQIREVYWDALTRRVDRGSLSRILPDEKSDSSGRFVYVPASDPLAYSLFTDLPDGVSLPTGTRIEQLPTVITPEYVRGLDGRHGVLSLGLRIGDGGLVEGVPFVVPGGRFNEMYGWDSYFEALGLIVDGRLDLARAMVDNFIYQIEHYGKILNANRTYYLTRSQPPFLTSMALAVYQHLPRTDATRDWLAGALRAAIDEYERVWMSDVHLTDTGLSRYFGTGIGPPPEVEPGHFDAVFGRFARRRGMTTATYEKAYREGTIEEPSLDRFFVHDRCVRESGHDTTYRWYDSKTDEDRCADFVTVDLNSLLFKYEIDMAAAIEKSFAGCLPRSGGCERAGPWRDRAERRREAMRRYLWNDELGTFFDYNVVTKVQSRYWNATMFYPLWACHRDDEDTFLLSRREAERLVAGVLARLEQPGGLAASSSESLPGASSELGARQWDHPNGWPPHQMIAWHGLENYGFSAEMRRLVYRWLYTITRNAYWYNGVIPEKYDVVDRTHRVFSEYGNVGTDFDYITREGFGWMNASFEVGLELLPDEHREMLNRVVPPEWVFGD